MNENRTDHEGRKMVHFLCGHETGEASHDETIPDYHPMTLGAVKSLIAGVEAGTVNPHSAQVRLAQAIVGMTCPRPIDGPVAQRLWELDRLFFAARQERGRLHRIADTLFTIMQGVEATS